MIFEGERFRPFRKEMIGDSWNSSLQLWTAANNRGNKFGDFGEQPTNKANKSALSALLEAVHKLPHKRLCCETPMRERPPASCTNYPQPLILRLLCTKKPHSLAPA